MCPTADREGRRLRLLVLLALALALVSRVRFSARVRVRVSARVRVRVSARVRVKLRDRVTSSSSPGSAACAPSGNWSISSCSSSSGGASPC